MIDSSSTRIHQHAANGKKSRAVPCIGRSRGRLTTKIHARYLRLPILLKITEGEAHDGRSAQDMIDTVKRGDVLRADRTYDSNVLRQSLAARGAQANVKPMPKRVTALRFNRWFYRKPNPVERFFSKIK